MRRWLGACLALVVAAAIALWDGESDARVVAPAAATAPARADMPRSAAEALVFVESAGRDERVTAEVTQQFPPDGEEPIREAAATSAHIAVRVLEPGGKPWAGGDLELLTLTAARSALLNDRSTYEVDRGRRAQAGEDRPVRYATRLVTDNEGRAEVPGVAAGQPFELRALDAARNVGGMLVGAPLAPEEVREEVLWLERAAEPVEGRCVDETGAPLERVRVSIGGFVCLSDADGRFTVPPLFGEAVELEGRRRGVVGRSERVPLPLAAPLEFVLDRARTLSVTLVDERGASFSLHGLQARGEDGGPRVDTHPEVRDGVHVFDSMPRAPVTLAIVGCGPSPTLAVDATTEQVRWTLPRPGEMVIELSRSPGELPSGVEIELRLSGSEETVFLQRVGLGQLQLPQRWTLFQGRYTLQFYSLNGIEPVERRPFGAPHEFAVRSGETVVVPFGN